jgi:hypothetical protein
MWIVVGIVAVFGCIVLVPVLVVGTWFVVVTVILGLADGTIWLLDQGWKKNRGGRRTGVEEEMGNYPCLPSICRRVFGSENMSMRRVAQAVLARP